MPTAIRANKASVARCAGCTGACWISSWPWHQHCLAHMLDQAGVIWVHTEQEETPACSDLFAPEAVSLLSVRTWDGVSFHVNQQSACRQVKIV